MLSILLLSSLFLIFALLILLFKPNLLFVLFALEIVLLGVNLNFVLTSFVQAGFFGEYITLILFSVAALDTSIGLIIILNYYNQHQNTNIKSIIKG
jgi:NADH-quinone oxidoreductase subunit K